MTPEERNELAKRIAEDGQRLHQYDEQRDRVIRYGKWLDNVPQQYVIDQLRNILGTDEFMKRHPKFYDTLVGTIRAELGKIVEEEKQRLEKM